MVVKNRSSELVLRHKCAVFLFDGRERLRPAAFVVNARSLAAEGTWSRDMNVAGVDADSQ